LLPRVTRTAGAAIVLTLMVMAGTAAFLIERFPRLPPMLPVHLGRGGLPDRWAPRTYALVLMPLFVQLALGLIFGAVTAILLWRAAPAPTAGGDAPFPLDAERRRADDERMQAAGEAVTLLALVWIAFQSLAAARVVRLWENGGGNLGSIYGLGLVTAVILSIVIATRSLAVIRRAPVHVAGDGPHWRMKVLYVNPADPALFVPARGGFGYTLNFGRRAAVLLLGLALLIGVGLPMLIVRLLTR
jgi:uncharacterized membrane protein